MNCHNGIGNSQFYEPSLSSIQIHFVKRSYIDKFVKAIQNSNTDATVIIT